MFKHCWVIKYEQSEEEKKVYLQEKYLTVICLRLTDTITTVSKYIAVMITSYKLSQKIKL